MSQDIINGDDVVYLTNIQKFVDGHGATYISGTVAEPDLSDFEDDFHGNFSEFLTSCFKDRIDWYRISQNEELGKLPHGDVFGEKLELIVWVKFTGKNYCLVFELFYLIKEECYENLQGKNREEKISRPINH